MLVAEYIPYSEKHTSDILRLLPLGADGISSIFLCWVVLIYVQKTRRPLENISVNHPQFFFRLM